MSPNHIFSFVKENLILLAGMTFFIVVLSLSLSTVFNDLFGQSSSLKKEDRAAIVNTPITAAKEPVEKTIPVRLIAPTADLAVPIENSKINGATNEWPLSDKTAHYANFTAKLGSEKGTMLIYGHNTMNVMRKTNNLDLGDIIYLVDENGKNWKFRFVDEKTIRPHEVSFIYEDVPFRVVMFTCHGWKDEFRRLMFFQPTE